MKNKLHTKALAIMLGCSVVLILGIFLSVYVIGEPVDGAQVTYTVSVNEQSLELQVAALESTVALRGWKFNQEGNTLYISAKKVLASPFFDQETYATSIDLREIQNVLFGGQVIWSK